MNNLEIQKILEKIKQVLPIFQPPQITDDMSEIEIEDKLAIYIMAFGKLNYLITLKALSNMMTDENKMKDFRNMPIATLARESVRLTEFTRDEKEKYKLSQQVRFYVDVEHKMMRACNALRASERLPQHDKPFTPLEEDYYCHSKMTMEEYEYWQDVYAGREAKKPIVMKYNPKTRQADFKEVSFEKV